MARWREACGRIAGQESVGNEHREPRRLAIAGVGQRGPGVPHA